MMMSKKYKKAKIESAADERNESAAEERAESTATEASEHKGFKGNSGIKVKGVKVESKASMNPLAERLAKLPLKKGVTTKERMMSASRVISGRK